ncbi:hypothetical protein BDQ12DRAFT_692836 [Crucibulum laeve]|uniref:Nephrocystin 3-like N-terminal domain-containing protein n=1 Tax=Crucibulum laeve TaxID=68775 RepID=A0A5C3LHP0_9AGAR|nr:hypothetical protein BDQ12DRAFT_692836 [Crucibulum laeve]
MFPNARNLGFHGGNFNDVRGDYHHHVHGRKGMDLLLERIAPGAFHNSEERFDPPKCHPRTRVAVLNKISNWVEDPMKKTSIMWMYGPAGAGKSAIAQTIAEKYDSSYLAASFFFARTSTDRNTSKPLIVTLAYQLLVSIPTFKLHVENIIENDPSIFSKSLETQMKTLIVEPLLKVLTAFSNMPPDSRRWPHLIIIDGLDECQGHQV